MAYDRKNLRGDFFGGITAGIVALPLALAFGVQSGLGAIYGLYGAMILGLLASVFGGTNTQISGPTGPMTVVTAMVIASAIDAAGSREAGMGIIIASFMLAGAILIVFGALRIGKAIRYMPYPVVSGFMSGIGVIIIIYQIYPLLGHVSEKSAAEVFLNINEPLSSINYQSFGLGILTIAIIYLFPKITRAVPSILIALIIATLVSVYFQFEVRTIGAIPEGIPELKLFELSKVSSEYGWLILEFAATLAALSAIDSLLTSVIADKITRTKHDSDKELVGQGIGNLVSGMFAGLPGAGATMRTVVNINSGGVTKLSGMIHSILILLILFGFGKYVSHIPLSVLAGILITVGIGIIDYRGFKHLFRVPKRDAVVLVTVLSITVFGNLLHAVGVGLVLACILFMKQASDLAERQMKIIPIKSKKEHQDIFSRYSSQIYIKTLNGPLFFGFTERFQEVFNRIDHTVDVLIFQMNRVPSIDQSGLYAIEDVITKLYEKKVIVLLCSVSKQPYNMLKKMGVVPTLIPHQHIFHTIDECEHWLQSHLEMTGSFEGVLKDLAAMKDPKFNK